MRSRGPGGRTGAYPPVGDGYHCAIPAKDETYSRVGPPWIMALHHEKPNPEEEMRSRQPRPQGSYEPTLVYRLAEEARLDGVNLRSAPGPWRPTERRVRRPGRKSLTVVPVVSNEQTEVMVDTKEHAIDVAGLLNWCGVHELNPIPELTPPAA